MGNSPQTKDYFSKNLDHITKRWLTCLQAAASSCNMLQETEKFTLGKPTMAFLPHQVFTLLEQKEWYWLMAGYMGKYKTLLLANPNVTDYHYLKPGHLLPDSNGGSDLQ